MKQLATATIPRDTWQRWPRLAFAYLFMFGLWFVVMWSIGTLLGAISNSRMGSATPAILMAAINAALGIPRWMKERA